LKSLLGRLQRSFPSLGKVNSFTEAVALLFEKRPRLCLAWLKEVGLIGALGTEKATREHANIVTQKWFSPLENHGNRASQVDLYIRARRILEDIGVGGAVPEIVMVESKIDSKEGKRGQLRRYAVHLDRMSTVGSRTLVYITRGYDPKDSETITNGLNGVEFKQLRWHDFYRFLQKVEKDALIKEVMDFMEEEGMSGTNNFSVSDLMALSGMQRALEVLDETLDEEIRGKLESLPGHVTKRKLEGRDFVQQMRADNGYWIYANLTQDEGLGCYLGYQMGNPDGSPRAEVGFWAYPDQIGEHVAVVAVEQLSNRGGW
jgi:hypothetical protein